jgi:DNA-binding MarR family transcriptional regulator
MPDNIPLHFRPEIVEMTQRLFRLRNRFRVGIPENLATLKKRIQDSRLEGKAGGVSDFDTFYNVGIVFSRYKDPITMGELSRDLNVPLSTATRIMDWFVSHGYVQRFSDAQDRRVVRVGLTEAGQEIYRTINETFMESIERFMRKLTSEERDIFHALLCKILDAFEEEIPVIHNNS